jgi:hypothetical protein
MSSLLQPSIHIVHCPASTIGYYKKGKNYRIQSPTQDLLGAWRLALGVLAVVGGGADDQRTRKQR